MGISFFKKIDLDSIMQQCKFPETVAFLLCRKRLGTALGWVIVNPLMFELLVTSRFVSSTQLFCSLC